MSLTPGARLGPYEVTALIGVGGMGEVYRATDTNLKRQVAIKVLPAAVAGDPDRLARFQREAEVLAALNHPNIAQIYGIEKSGGTIALVMELVEGPTLAERLATPGPRDASPAAAPGLRTRLAGGPEGPPLRLGSASPYSRRGGPLGPPTAMPGPPAAIRSASVGPSTSSITSAVMPLDFSRP